MSTPTKTIWVTKDGMRVRVQDMTDSHLVNTIRYLRRCAEAQRLEAALHIGDYLASDPHRMAHGWPPLLPNEILTTWTPMIMRLRVCRRLKL